MQVPACIGVMVLNEPDQAYDAGFTMHEVLQVEETNAGVETVATTIVRPALPTVRNVAVDAYRGLVMLLMMGEVLQFAKVSAYYNHSIFWKILGWNQTHTEWSGCSLHDMIQPSFSFLVGVALPYSIRSRQRKGAQFSKMLLHTIWRSVVLIALGILLRSLHSSQTNFTFEDTLTQIGLGYTFLFLAGLSTGTRPVDRFQRHPIWILAGLGALSCSGAGLRLCRSRCSQRLASSVHRFPRSLEQKQQFRPGL